MQRCAPVTTGGDGFAQRAIAQPVDGFVAEPPRTVWRAGGGETGYFAFQATDVPTHGDVRRASEGKAQRLTPS